MTSTLTQSVIFRNGPHDGKCAQMIFTLPFEMNKPVSVGGRLYSIVPGPIAQAIEMSQETMKHGMLVLILSGTGDA